VKSTGNRPGDPYLKAALGIAAMAAARTKSSYYGAKYRRIAARRGPMKALVAVERAILVAIWHMLSDGSVYDDPGRDYYTSRTPDTARTRAIHQLERLGYLVTLEPLRETA
jgi:transposase